MRLYIKKLYLFESWNKMIYLLQQRILWICIWSIFLLSIEACVIAFLFILEYRILRFLLHLSLISNHIFLFISWWINSSSLVHVHTDKRPGAIISYFPICVLCLVYSYIICYISLSISYKLICSIFQRFIKTKMAFITYLWY